jgi:hypothetical protein
MTLVTQGRLTGLNQRLYFDGFDASGDVGSVDNCDITRGQMDTSALNNVAMRRLLLLADLTFGYTAFYNPGVAGGTAPFGPDAGIHAKLATLPTTPRYGQWLLEGPYLGAAALQYAAKQVTGPSYRRQQSGAMTAPVSFHNSEGFATEFGVMLTDGGRQTFASAGNGTSLDNGAGTTKGLAAVINHFSVTSAGGVTYSIQHSTDNSAWTTLLTFTTVPVTATAGYGERVVVQGTVNRYLRVLTAGTFTNAIAAVSVRRGLTTDVNGGY